MKHLRMTLVASSIALLAAGCGGGSGGGSSAGGGVPTAAVPITPANATVVAKGAMTPSQGMVTTAGKTAGVIGAMVAPSGSTRSVLDISLAEFNRVRALQMTPGVAGVITGGSVTCSGGGTTAYSFNDANNNNTFDVGDAVTLTSTNCVPAPGTTLNGSMTFAITAASGALQLGAATGTSLNPFTATFTLTFNNYSIVTGGLTESINGDITFSTSDDGTNTTGTMAGTSLSMNSSVDGAFNMSNYNFSFTQANLPTATTPYSFSVSMTVASVVANGSIVITTPTAFTGQGSTAPTAGVMVITGANSSTLTLTSNPDGVHIQQVVDEDGAGPIAPVTITPDTTWTAI